MIDENRLTRENENDDLEKLIDRQSKRLKELNTATTLIGGKQSVKNELWKAHEELLQLSCKINETKNMLKKLNEQNHRCREILMLLETLDKRILHQDENVPPELIQSYQNARKSPNMLDCAINSRHQLATQMPSSMYATNFEVMKDCKKTLFNEPEICPTIPFMTEEELNKMPKYIIGRPTPNTLDIINNFISGINQTLIAKYTILSMGKVVAKKKGEINLYLHYKKQQFDMRKENGYLYFFTAEDYERRMQIKIDKTKLNFIPALRHCKRLRECRIKNELRYVITP